MALDGGFVRKIRLRLAPRTRLRRLIAQLGGLIGRLHHFGYRIRGLYVRGVHRGMNELMQRGWARRAQGLFCFSEHNLLTASQRADFPFKVISPNPKRVLFGISSLTSGGAERQMIYTLAGASSRAIESHLLVEYLTDRPGSAFFLPEARQHAHSISELTNDDLHSHPWLASHPEFARALSPFVANRVLNAARQIAAASPHVVQTSLDWTNVQFGIAAVLAGVPRVIISGRNISPLHFEFFNWFMFPGYRALLAQPNVTMTNNSQAGADDYANWLGIPSNRIVVLRNALDQAAFPPISIEERAAARRELGIEEDVKVIAGAFRMSHEKRPLLWVETAAMIRARMPRVQFHLYGIGPMADAVKAHATAHGLDDCFSYHGVSANLRVALAPTDLVLQASEMEGTPNVLIEAQAMGLPVVTPPARGAAEAVEDGVTGRVVYLETAAGLAEAALSVLQNDLFLSRARIAGPPWVERTFGMRRMIDETIALHTKR